MADRNLAKEAALSVDALRSALYYDPETGRFIRLTDNSTKYPSGSLAGTISSHGYITIRVCNNRFLAHRLAWFYVYGEWPTEIDHINRDKGDNRLINLRCVTRKENIINTGGRGEFGIKNIHRKRKNFVVHLRRDGVDYRQIFRCLGQAVKARNAMTLQLDSPAGGQIG